MIQEYKKLKNTPYIWISFLMMAIAPLLLLFFWTIEIYRAETETLNNVNMFLLASFHCKITFPMLALMSIKIDHGIEGIKTGYYLPIKKSKIVYQKVIFTYIWLMVLFLFSLMINTIVHWSMFNDWLFLEHFLMAWKSYLLALFLGLTMINLTYVFFIMFNNYILTIVVFTSSLVLGYALQSIGDYYFIFSGVPKIISDMSGHKTDMYMNLSLMVLVCLVMIYKTKVLFKKIEKE